MCTKDLAEYYSSFINEHSSTPILTYEWTAVLVSSRNRSISEAQKTSASSSRSPGGIQHSTLLADYSCKRPSFCQRPLFRELDRGLSSLRARSTCHQNRTEEQMKGTVRPLEPQTSGWIPERHDDLAKALCYGDIDLFVIRNPDGGSDVIVAVRDFHNLK
jgi:hypothetical protein